MVKHCKPYIVALTGGIGSGKSTATEIFTQLGVPIIDTDVLARLVVAPHTPLLHTLVAHFGQGILQSDGALDRTALRTIIFADLKQKKWLESQLHPAIDQCILEQIQHIEYPYCIVVIPLLVENYDRYSNLVDHILVIDLPEAEQLARATLRDQDPELIQKIIQSQASSPERLKIANTIISNDGNLASFKNKIVGFHKSMLCSIS